MVPFVIFSLPRSRSAWLSTLLCASGRLVGHDIGIECDTTEDFIKELTLRGGTCETGAAFAWRQIQKNFPDSPLAVVLRDPKDVSDSLTDKGFPGYLDEMETRFKQLEEISAQPGVFSCTFEELQDSCVVADLYKYCTKSEVSPLWVDKLQKTNIQIDLDERMERLSIRRDNIESLKNQIKSQEFDTESGLTIQVEPWSESLWKDARTSAEAHFEEVDGGVEPNRPFDLDQDIMNSLQTANMLLVVTARLNKRFIGYFTWQIMPDVESKGLLIAQQGAWYVQPGNPRAAIKMFDVSIEELRLRGVRCIFPHHRVQGRGANIGKFFIRRGAKLTQHTYSLWIGDK